MNVFAIRHGQTARSLSGASQMKELLERYGCSPIEFTGTDDALYERHLVFDNVMEATEIGARERFEAVARSVRDVLSQRWREDLTIMRETRQLGKEIDKRQPQWGKAGIRP